MLDEDEGTGEIKLLSIKSTVVLKFIVRFIKNKKSLLSFLIYI
jgi:hypothetical protein